MEYNFKKFSNVRLLFKRYKNKSWPGLYLFDNNNNRIINRDSCEDISIFISKIDKSKIDKLDTCAMFFQCQILSYGHSLNELIKLIYIYIHQKLDIPIIIPEKCKTQYDLISLFINKNKIIIIKDDFLYNIDHIYIFENKDSGAIPANDNYNNILTYFRKELFEKIKHIEMKTYDIIVNVNRSSAIFEPERIFHNYDDFYKKIKSQHNNILFFEPRKFNYIEQIYLFSKCKLFICDYGSAINNIYFMSANSSCITIVHPWLAYFGKNHEKSNYYQLCKKYLPIKFIPIFSKTFINGKLYNNNFVVREKAKTAWGSLDYLDKSYKYFINIESIIEKMKNLI